MKTISLTIIITIINIVFSGNIFVSQKNIQSVNVNSNSTQQCLEIRMERLIKREYSDNYELTIEFIKEHEGFNKGFAYTCLAGYRTIGHGHMIKKGEVFPNRISAERADKLLRKDFDKAIELCEMYSDVTGSKKLAIAHFIFAKGIGNYLRSELKNCVDNEQPIEEEILKWCVYYKLDGTKIRSNYSYKIRVWELEMYNK